MLKIILILTILINYKINAINSASVKVTTEAANEIMNTFSSSTIEGLEFKTNADKMTVEDPPMDSLILDDIERQLKDIFVVNFVPKSLTTTTPIIPDEFSSVEMETYRPGKKFSLGRRTNFRTRLNCRCIIRNRCAKSDSCIKNSKEQGDY